MDSIQSINDESKSEATTSQSRPNSSPKNEADKIQRLNSKVKKHAANISVNTFHSVNTVDQIFQ